VLEAERGPELLHLPAGCPYQVIIGSQQYACIKPGGHDGPHAAHNTEPLLDGYTATVDITWSRQAT
jgi:hypothetical protein